MRKTMSAIDLFCGAGGLTHGFVLEGIPVMVGIDSDESCKYPFEHNNGSRFILKDVEALKGKEISALFPSGDIKILMGCAPCQPFSTYTQGRDKREDSKWKLLRSFARVVEKTAPEIVTMENVPKLAKHRVFDDFVDILERSGYHITYKEVYCPLYGVPQTRKRLVLLASLLGDIELMRPIYEEKSAPTVREKIGRLEPLAAGEVSNKDPLHRASKLSDRNLKRIRASRPGGTWRDWNDKLVAACHKKMSGKTYPGVYGRMAWDDQAPTITTQCYGFGNGRFGHPEQDRAISLREAALLQTFPEYYEFVSAGEPIAFKKIGRLIGNAVPVELGRMVARSIKSHVEQYDV